jgi:hypothetical protein
MQPGQDLLNAGHRPLIPFHNVVRPTPLLGLHLILHVALPQPHPSIPVLLLPINVTIPKETRPGHAPHVPHPHRHKTPERPVQPKQKITGSVRFRHFALCEGEAGLEEFDGELRHEGVYE